MRWTIVLNCVGKYTKDFSNLPDRYIRRAMRQVYFKTPATVNYRQRTLEKTDFNFDLERPWTEGFKHNNRPWMRAKQTLVEPIRDWPVFRGDRVELLVGKDKGKQGFINYIVQERNWVIVEGLNCEYKYNGGRGDYPGLMTKSELPLSITTEIALVDPSDSKPTKIEWRYTEDGERVRVSVRTGRIIPIPLKSEETIDYKTKGTYKEQPKDTRSEDITAITFNPSLRTFEMEIMDDMGIEENGTPQKTYWY
ncbi:39S ribosomal protein L24, mitochondrial [Chamberlinius hualienensis]